MALLEYVYRDGFNITGACSNEKNKQKQKYKSAKYTYGKIYVY